MFTDWAEALEAEPLPLDPTTAQQYAAAARVTARSSHDKDDLGLLLDALGLPTDTDTITALLPLLPEAGDTPVTTTAATEPIDVPVIPLPASNPVQKLLDWATAHPAAQIRNCAARISTDLAELTERRRTEAAQREAEEKVAQAKAELERAQEALRTVKASTRTTSAGPISARTGSGSGRSREKLAAIRSWARENGHQVADQGMVPRRIQEAYDAAHQDSARKAG
ncbi:histone-like nucleoid-structuring protein Lsr2 [Streptomyces sp. MW-W600-10]|uniref:Lsr2 family DNA-binding protein n=1 Tax=Streptomyces sp. MW-W600-10 TaxID=2829819 RepID=UPI001C48F9DB|nr:histone-like nucleoid-structuring protein Lsr2 [Streptomyces sp. MW-W600-10]MBV7249274.1 Lsr2 family protein [Streptomyces sp. MW-W600-10]